MAKAIQPAMTRGEIAPDLYGRVDTNLYQLALRTARNVLIHPHGGVSNRAGTIFVGPVADHTRRPRLIKFEFKTTDTHIIELGHEYIRIIRNDAHVTETAVNVTGATKANPVEITTSGAHGFSTGDEVFLTAIGGMTEITEERWLITVTGATTFTLQDQVDGTNVDGTAYTTYTSGGTAARVFTLTTTYQEDDLRDIKFTQTADIMTLTHPSYAPAQLARLALDNWTLTDVSFAPTQAAPTSVALTVNTTGAVTVRYKVTATSSSNEEESLPGLATTAAVNITAITKANPAVVTAATHGLYDGAEIQIDSVGGMTELNGRRFRVNIVDSNNVQLRDVDSTDFTTYTSGGTVKRAYIQATNGATSYDNTVSWGVVANARFYSVYREDNGIFGFIGDTEGLSFEDDSSIVPNLDETPPQERNPFFGTDNAPTAIGNHQQRRVFGGSNNAPDTSYYSRTGVSNNFTTAVPVRDDDAITAVLPATQVNQIRHYVSLRDLLVFTSGAEWLVKGSSDTGFSASTIQQQFQSNWGCSNVPPLVIGQTVLFVLDGGIGVRSLGFRLETDSFSSNDIALLVPHLLKNYVIAEWAYTRVPDPVIYAVRSDGEVLALTFQEEQQVIAWSHFDTSGFFESVAATRPIAASTFEVPYYVVKRTINGRVVRYIERADSRKFNSIQDAFFVDCGLTYDIPLTITDITAADPVVVTSTAHNLENGDQVDLSDITWVADFDTNQNETQPAQLNGGRYVVANKTANTFELTSLEDGTDIDGSAFNAYVSGGEARLAVQTVSGLRHLAGESVSILADGNVLTPILVSAFGVITLPRRFSRLHAGLSYVSDIQTLDIETQDGSGSIQGVPKSISSVNVKFKDSRGLLAGPSSANLTEMKQREDEAYGAPTTLLTGDKTIVLNDKWNTNGRIFLRQKDPLPMTILAIAPEIEVGDF